MCSCQHFNQSKAGQLCSEGPAALVVPPDAVPDKLPNLGLQRAQRGRGGGAVRGCGGQLQRGRNSRGAAAMPGKEALRALACAFNAGAVACTPPGRAQVVRPWQGPHLKLAALDGLEEARRLPLIVRLLLLGHDFPADLCVQLQALVGLGGGCAMGRCSREHSSYAGERGRNRPSE